MGWFRKKNIINVYSTRKPAMTINVPLHLTYLSPRRTGSLKPPSVERVRGASPAGSFPTGPGLAKPALQSSGLALQGTLTRTLFTAPTLQVDTHDELVSVNTTAPVSARTVLDTHAGVERIAARPEQDFILTHDCRWVEGWEELRRCGGTLVRE